MTHDQSKTEIKTDPNNECFVLYCYSDLKQQVVKVSREQDAVDVLLHVHSWLDIWNCTTTVLYYNDIVFS